MALPVIPKQKTPFYRLPYLYGYGSYFNVLIVLMVSISIAQAQKVSNILYFIFHN